METRRHISYIYRAIWFQITPIELVRYIASIANGGILITPHLFLSTSSSNLANNYEIVQKI